MVETKPAGVILRMALFPASATYKLPDASMSISVGELNIAAVPVALVYP